MKILQETPKLNSPLNPLRPIAALGTIIDSTYSRRIKSAKSALERSNQV